MVLVGTSARADAISLRFVSWQGELTGLLMAGDEGSVVSVPVSEFSLGRPVTLQRKPKVLRLFREEIVPDGGSVRVPMAEVTIPADADQVIVMLAKAPVGATFPMVGRALDSSWAVHPPAMIRVMNLSTKALALRIGGSMLSLPAGGEELVAFPAENVRHVPMEVAAGMTDGWRMVSRSLRPTPAGARVLCLVRDGRASIDDPAAPVDVCFLLDRTPPRAEAVVQR